MLTNRNKELIEVPSSTPRFTASTVVQELKLDSSQNNQ